MGIAQSDDVFVLRGKLGQRRHDIDQAHANQAQGLTHLNKVGVIADKRARSPEVDNAPRLRTLIAVGPDMSHDIVAELAFVVGRNVKINRFDVGAEFLDLILANIEPFLRLGFGQRDPEPPPGLEFILRRKYPTHVAAGIAVHERIDILFVMGECIGHSVDPSNVIYAR